ncbi:MAG: outer membrane lipoprotein-sorting protein [Bacteroidia bacterium]
MNLSRYKILGIAILGSIAISMKNAPISANQILKKAEDKLTSSTIVSEMDITITRPKWSKTMSLKTWGKGSDYAMAYVMAPDKDKGVVYLKSKSEVYNYLPKINKTVKLPAALLSQNWMGTDMSTDDLVKLTKLTSDYNASIDGSEMVSGRDCYKINLLPKDEADVLWGKLVLCIDKKEFVQMKTVFFDEDLEVVNTMTSSNLKNMGGKIMPSKMVMKPEGKKGHSTQVTYKSMKFNSPIPTSFFTKGNMPKVKP